MSSQNARHVMKSAIAVVIMLAAVAAFVLCEVSLSSVRDERSDMNDSAQTIRQIESVGGKTLEEAYYTWYGFYLSSQARMAAETATIQARGVELLSVFGFLAGIYMLTDRKTEAVAAASVDEQALPPL